MIARNCLLSLFTVFLLSLLAIAAQAQNETLANRQPHYFDINDWDIDADSINYAKHIAPILQRSCTMPPTWWWGPMSFTSYEEVRPWAPVICTAPLFAIEWAQCHLGMLRKTSG